MNLKEFIKHGQLCPLCGSNSTTLKLNTFKQSHRYEADNIVVTRDMRDRGNGKNYEISYSVNIHDNSFTIEFSNNKSRLNSSISLILLQRFRALNHNIKQYNFIRECGNCNKFKYISNTFAFDTNKCYIGELKVNHEYMTLVKQIGGKFRLFKLSNNYDMDQCIVRCSNVSNLNWAPYDDMPDALTFELKPFPFTSEREVTNRLNKLLAFV